MSEVNSAQVVDMPKNWVVRLIKKENPDRWLWFDKNGNFNARLTSAMPLDKETAIQFARAVNSSSTDLHARAYLYETSRKQKQMLMEARKQGEGRGDALKSEEMVELEALREEVKVLRELQKINDSKECTKAEGEN